MKNSRKIRTLIMSSMILSMFFLILFHNISVSYAQSNGETLSISSNFEMFEYSDKTGIKNDINSIDFTLPSSTWNVTDIELNFTSVKLGSEIKTIENGGGSNYYTIGWTEELGYGVQINITEQTTIFGVCIYGHRDVIEPKNDVFIQIRGYKEHPDNIPNKTIYGSEKININTIPNWYIQTFSTPIDLPVGYYYLIINGSNLTEDDTSYNWRYNHIDPTYQDLHVAKYDGSSWSDDGIGKTLRYKLIQRVNRSYNPEEINMTVEFDGINYNVTNGTIPYTGNTTISNKNFSPNNENLHIPVKNNKSIELLLNLSYRIKLKNKFSTEASVLIKGLSDNAWSLTPNIDRTNDNYSVKFKYPNSWYNLTVFRDGSNITEDVSDNGDSLIISNNSIIEGSDWKITANSPNIDFSLDVPLTELEPSQKLRCTVQTPDLQGNVTFVLIDSLGIEEYRKSKGIDSSETTFEFSIPLNPFEGKWIAYIYWNNVTDAGFRSQIFIITIPSSGGNNDSVDIIGIDPQLVFIAVLIIIVSIVAGLTSYQIAKRYRRVHEAHRQNIFNKYMDILNLSYIIIIEKNTGLNVFEQILVGKEEMDVSLLSGFLEAIRTFGIELTGSSEQSQTIKLEYQNSKIIMAEFKDFRIISVMKDNPSQDFFESLKPLSHDIDRYYGKSLKNFDGELSQFKGIKELLEEHLNISLIYPLKVVMSKDEKLPLGEKIIVNKAFDAMKQRKNNYFYVSNLMPEKEFNVRNAELILKLVQKKIFQPIK